MNKLQKFRYEIESSEAHLSLTQELTTT